MNRDRDFVAQLGQKLSVPWSSHTCSAQLREPGTISVRLCRPLDLHGELPFAAPPPSSLGPVPSSIARFHQGIQRMNRRCCPGSRTSSRWCASACCWPLCTSDRRKQLRSNLNSRCIVGSREYHQRVYERAAVTRQKRYPWSPSQALAEAAARDADDDWVRIMGAAAGGCDGRLHLEPVLERFSLVSAHYKLLR